MHGTFVYVVGDGGGSTPGSGMLSGIQREEEIHDGGLLIRGRLMAKVPAGTGRNVAQPPQQ